MVEPMAVNAAVIVAVMLLGWVAAARIGDVSFVDAIWGGGMALLALTSLAQSDGGARAQLIAALATLWGARLALHLWRRWRKSGRDRRYDRILRRDSEAGRFALGAAQRVFAPQALLLFITCLPAQLGVLAPDRPLGLLAALGAVLWFIGMTFETIGDFQLIRFRADPANRGKVLDTGLWRYTRHPNYFGDACVWWGIWLVAAEAGWPIALTALTGPVFLTFTLTRWSGKPLLEASLTRNRPDYVDYVARTSGFIPMPPRRRAV